MRSPLYAALLVCSGCAVGPDYAPETVELPESFDAGASIASADGTAMPGLWESFGNAELTRLIELAESNNTSIRSALATLNETRALSGLAIYSLFPTVTTSAEVERSRFSDEDPFAFPGLGVVERYRAGFDAAWEIDIFGSLRRQAESVRYRVEADTAALYAIKLAIVAEVAQTYFQWQGESRRLGILRANLANQADSLAILEAGLEAGRGTAFDVSRARAVERQIAAAVPVVEAAIVRAEQRLAVLTGQSAADVKTLLSVPASLPALPRLVAVGAPTEWLARRPDVLAAERRLASATANIGVATAELYPKLNLVGEFGWTGLESSSIGSSSADRWRVAPALSWRILDYGRVKQRILEAEAQSAGALAAFEEAWRVALEETENALANYRATTERAARLTEAVAEATEAARLAELRYNVGEDAYLAVLDADRTRIELDDLLAQAETDRATALAALYKALGGDFAVAETAKEVK